jgi:hypothetical protein
VKRSEKKEKHIQTERNDLEYEKNEGEKETVAGIIWIKAKIVFCIS